MRLSVATYEKLLTWPLMRAAIAVFSRMVAWWHRGDSYREMAWLLRAYRALRSVPPGNVSGYLERIVKSKIANLRSGNDSGQYLIDFLRFQSNVAMHKAFQALDTDYRVRLKFPKKDDIQERLGDLIVLKPSLPGGEKGVLLVKYSPSIATFVSTYDIGRLAEKYRFVLEPSTWGYQDPDFFLFLHLGTDVFIEAQFEPDRRFIEEIGENLTPLGFGAGDWVDPARFRLVPGVIKQFDIVMVASWLRLKRHWLLFEAISQIPSKVNSVALVGVPSGGRERRHVEAEAKAAGIYDKIRWFENVSHDRVSEIIQESRMSLMLSTREGASRAIYESLFCDVPVIVSKANIGVNRAHVVPETGIFCDDADLADGIAWMLDNLSAFSPRAWAVSNTGYHNTARILEGVVRSRALAADEPWTMGILPKTNGPGLRYVSRQDWEKSRSWYEELKSFLR